MRCASRYDDVGPLRYHQHPLFFQTMDPLQLAQIEDNSPVSRRSAFILILKSNKCSLGWIENAVSLRLGRISLVISASYTILYRTNRS